MSFLIPVQMNAATGNEEDEDDLFFFQNDIDILPTYSLNTLADDKKIRLQYVKYAIHKSWIATDYVDTHADSYYSNNKSLPAEPGVSTAAINSTSQETVPSTNDTTITTPPPQSSSSTSPTTSTTTTTTTSLSSSLVITKVRVIQENVTTITLDPVTNQVHHQTQTISRPDLIDLRRESANTSHLVAKPLFTYGRIFSYLSSKITASKSLYDNEGMHNLCLASIKPRYLASLKRMMNHELEVSKVATMNHTKWNQIQEAVMTQAKDHQLPLTTKVYFPITKSMLTYLSFAFPQGTSWFPLFILYCCVYQLGVRNSSIAHLKWSDITYHRRFMYMEEPDELREVCIEISYCKKKMKKLHYPMYLVGYTSIPSTHPNYVITSPDVLFWLNLLLFEKEGITVEQLLVEKMASTHGTDRYRRLSNTYIFTMNLKDWSMNAVTETDASMRKRADALSVTMNKRMMEVAHFAGLSNRILDMTTIHHSLRQGAVVESESALRKSDTNAANRNVQGGWSPSSNVPTSVYDVSNISQHYQYANTRFSILSSSLPQHRDENVFVNNNEIFTKHHLVEFIKSSNHVEDCTFKDFNDTTTSFCEHNMDLVHTLWTALIKPQLNPMTTSVVNSTAESYIAEKAGKTRSSNFEIMGYVFKRAIGLAVREKKGISKHCSSRRMNIIDEYEESRKTFLSYLNYQRRDEMATYILSSLQPYSDINKTMKELMQILSTRIITQQTVSDHVQGSSTIIDAVVANRKSASVPTTVQQVDISEMKTASDATVQAEMKKMVDASLEELNECVTLMISTSPLKSQESSQKASKHFSLYNILSFRLYGSTNMTDSIHTRAIHKGYNDLFTSFYSRLDKTQQDVYDQAKKNRVARAGMSKEAVEEIMDCLKAYPAIRHIYGWGRLILAFCPIVRREGLEPQQFKDIHERIFTKAIKGSSKSSLYRSMESPEIGAATQINVGSPMIRTPQRGEGYVQNQRVDAASMMDEETTIAAKSAAEELQRVDGIVQNRRVAAALMIEKETTTAANSAEEVPQRTCGFLPRRRVDDITQKRQRRYKTLDRSMVPNNVITIDLPNSDEETDELHDMGVEKRMIDRLNMNTDIYTAIPSSNVDLPSTVTHPQTDIVYGNLTPPSTVEGQGLENKSLISSPPFLRRVLRSKSLTTRAKNMASKDIITIDLLTSDTEKDEEMSEKLDQKDDGTDSYVGKNSIYNDKDEEMSIKLDQKDDGIDSSVGENSKYDETIIGTEKGIFDSYLAQFRKKKQKGKRIQDKYC